MTWMTRHAIVISLTLLASASPGFADQRAVDPAANAKLGALRQAAPSNAYRQLFEAREALRVATAQASKNAAPAPKKKIVCGMTVIEVGPEIDPKIAITPPKDPNVRYTIRAVDPPICNSSPPK